jgi:hypothetical protein
VLEAVTPTRNTDASMQSDLYQSTQTLKKIHISFSFVLFLISWFWSSDLHDSAILPYLRHDEKKYNVWNGGCTA